MSKSEMDCEQLGNFQSLMCKKEQFWLVTEETNSDIMIECETHLRTGVFDAEFCPPNF